MSEVGHGPRENVYEKICEASIHAILAPVLAPQRLAPALFLTVISACGAPPQATPPAPAPRSALIAPKSLVVKEER